MFAYCSFFFFPFSRCSCVHPSNWTCASCRGVCRCAACKRSKSKKQNQNSQRQPSKKAKGALPSTNSMRAHALQGGGVTSQQNANAKTHPAVNVQNFQAEQQVSLLLHISPTTLGLLFDNVVILGTSSCNRPSYSLEHLPVLAISVVGPQGGSIYRTSQPSSTVAATQADTSDGVCVCATLFGTLRPVVLILVVFSTCSLE